MQQMYGFLLSLFLFLACAIGVLAVTVLVGGEAAIIILLVSITTAWVAAPLMVFGIPFLVINFIVHRICIAKNKNVLFCRGIAWGYVLFFLYSPLAYLVTGEELRALAAKARTGPTLTVQSCLGKENNNVAGDKDLCLTLAAQSTNNPEGCAYIQAKQIKSSCYSSIATNTRIHQQGDVLFSAYNRRVACETTTHLYWNQGYRFGFSCPSSETKITQRDPLTIELNKTWGDLVQPIEVLDIESVQKEDEQTSVKTTLRLKVYPLKDYRTGSQFAPFYEGMKEGQEGIAYDSSNKNWYTKATGTPINEEYIQEHYSSMPEKEEWMKQYQGIPRIFTKTFEGIPIYKIFVYADMGFSKTNYVLIDEKLGHVLEFSGNNSVTMDLDLVSNDNQEHSQELTNTINNRFLDLLRSVYFE